jgi:glycosyltransferase involved in cell wall biosynthesis
MILLPARNEGPRVGDIVREAAATYPGVEIVVVANGCTDDTERQAEAAGATVLRSAPGYGMALLTGYRHALRRWERGEGPRWLVQLDADGQHPTHAIPHLVDALHRCHLVIGSRLAPGGSAGGWPTRRRWTVTALGWWTQIVSGAPVRDVASGFQAMRPAVVRALVQDFPVDMVDANVLVRLWRQGFSVSEVGVEMAPRAGGESMHGGWQSAVYAGRMVVQTSREARR